MLTSQQPIWLGWGSELTFLYNDTDPYIGGWPRFYWLQLLFVVLGVGTTALVYRMTRRSPEERAAAERAIARDAGTTARPTDREV